MTTKKRIETLIHQLLEKYRLVRSQVNDIERAGTNIDKAHLFEGLRANLDEIKTIESEMSPLRDRYEADGGSFDAETRAQIDETIEIVSSLIPQLGTMEEIAKSDRSKLAPRIHDGVRAMQMQSAYTRATGERK